MTYKVYTKDKNGNIETFATATYRREAEDKVKLAESYWAYIDAWYVRTD